MVQPSCCSVATGYDMTGASRPHEGHGRTGTRFPSLSRQTGMGSLSTTGPLTYYPEIRTASRA